MPRGKRKVQFSISAGKPQCDIFAALKERYGVEKSAVVDAYMRLTDDPFRELARREAQAVEHVDAPVQEAEHAVA
jgi:hypothetical protein